MMKPLIRRARMHTGQHTRRRPPKKWRPLSLLLAMAALITMVSAAAPASAQSIRQPPGLETSVSVSEVDDLNPATDGISRTLLVEVKATTRVPSPLTKDDPFTGFGQFEITLDFPGAYVSTFARPRVVPIGPLDTTFCAPGMTTCEVNPDNFLTKDQSVSFAMVIVAPCDQRIQVRSVVTARPDGYARPDAESSATAVSNGRDDCESDVEEEIRYALPDRGIPVRVEKLPPDRLVKNPVKLPRQH